MTATLIVRTSAICGLIHDNINNLFVAQPVARSLVTKYIGEYGTITCANIQLQLYNRFFYLEDMEEFKKLSSTL